MIIELTGTPTPSERRHRGLYTSTLTPTEVTVLRYYDGLKKTGRMFCRSLETIAAACGCSSKSVQRANDHFFALGILLWAPGNSRPQANWYTLDLRGITGWDTVLGRTRKELSHVRKQLGATLNSQLTNHPTRQPSNSPTIQQTNNQRV
jgi:hypothetical protein